MSYWPRATGTFFCGVETAKLNPFCHSIPAGPRATLMDLRSKFADKFDDHIILTVDGKECLPLKVRDAMLQLQAEVEFQNLVSLTAIPLASVWFWCRHTRLACMFLGVVTFLGTIMFDPEMEKLGYVRHVEVAFLVVQLLCLAFQYVIYTKIQAMPSDGKKFKIPEVKQFGQIQSPATEQLPREYDMGKSEEAIIQNVMSLAIMCCNHYCGWGFLFPFALQVLMAPLQLYDSPLCQVHILGKTLTRPYPVANHCGFPEMLLLLPRRKKED